MERKFSFAPGEYYHIFSRGVEKRKIFLDQADYLRFLALLYTSNGTKRIHLSDYSHKDLRLFFALDRGQPLMAIGAYCLMPNHVHLLIRAKKGSNVSLCMNKLLTSFSMYFNIKYERSGPLFVHPFRARQIESDLHLRHLFAYIHLNPLDLIEPGWSEKGLRHRQAAKKFLAKYPYSSFFDYSAGQRLETVILSPREFPEYFLTRKDFVEFLDDWLKLKTKFEVEI